MWVSAAARRSGASARAAGASASRFHAAGRLERRFTQASPAAASVLEAWWTYDADDPAYGTRWGLLAAVEGSDGYRRELRYDALRRPHRVTTRVPKADAGATADPASRTFVMQYGYDRNYGRPKATRYPSGETVGFDYGALGHLLGEAAILADGTRGRPYRRVRSMSARNQVTAQELGNCAVDVALFDASTGLETFRSTLRPTGARSPGGACPVAAALVRQVRYTHDHLLNLARQEKNFAGGQADETYAYDELQRLLTARRAWIGAGLPATATEDSYAYDDLGNITKKSDYAAAYKYAQPNAACSARPLAGPHAVSSVVKSEGGVASFCYDANGNLVEGDGRTVGFDDLDRPVRVTRAGFTTNFSYAPDGGRYRQTTNGPTSPKFGPKTVY